MMRPGNPSPGIPRFLESHGRGAQSRVGRATAHAERVGARIEDPRNRSGLGWLHEIKHDGFRGGALAGDGSQGSMRPTAQPLRMVLGQLPQHVAVVHYACHAQGVKGYTAGTLPLLLRS
jgi:hypothetical protein